MVDQLFSSLESDAQLAFGTFCVEDLSTWGGLQTDGGDCYIAEKPRSSISLSARSEATNKESPQTLAWGIFGFQEEVGVELFQALLSSSADHLWKKLPAYPALLPLSQFGDLTR